MRGIGAARALTLAAVTAAALLAACGDGSDERVAGTGGPARPYMMGFSTTPRELNVDAYADAFELAGDHGDMVLIQRTPPWADFLGGADIGEETAATTAAERRAIDDHDLTLFFAIDPTDGSTARDRLAGLPAALNGATFGDEQVRLAFLAYASYVALNYRPAYLALGVEMNLYYQKHQDDWENFRTLYEATYDAVKEISPETRVTVTLQYEDLQGILPTVEPHFADWQLVRSLEDTLDIVAISTYPSFAFPSAASIPENYFSQLRAFTDRPIAIAEMGYASAAGIDGANSGTEEDQRDFLGRVLQDAERMEMPFVIWFAGWDPTYARGGPYNAFQHIGLLRDDNSEKLAWPLWADAARRPYQAAATVARR
jgi:hypothetical protein